LARLSSYSTDHQWVLEFASHHKIFSVCYTQQHKI
jgi:hypothetical protein